MHCSCDSEEYWGFVFIRKTVPLNLVLINLKCSDILDQIGGYVINIIAPEACGYG